MFSVSSAMIMVVLDQEDSSGRSPARGATVATCSTSTNVFVLARHSHIEQ